MAGAELGLLAVALASQGLRLAGMLLAGTLRPDHPFIRWAAAVAQATLAAFVVLAVVAPSGAVALLPWPARLAGASVALAMMAWPRAGILGALLAGSLATLATWSVLG